MTVFEYIIFLFKKLGVREKTEKKRLSSPKPVTKIFTFKLKQSLIDTE